jgi:hypothetical protein
MMAGKAGAMLRIVFDSLAQYLKTAINSVV